MTIIIIIISSSSSSRPHRSNDAAYRYRRSSVVCLCVCMSVCVTLMSTAKTDERTEMPFGWPRWVTRVGPMNHVLDEGPDYPRRRGTYRGGSAHWKALSHRCGVCSKKSITASARLLLLTALLSTGRCHINFFSSRIRIPAMRPFVKILWSFVIIEQHLTGRVLVIVMSDKSQS